MQFSFCGVRNGESVRYKCVCEHAMMKMKASLRKEPKNEKVKVYPITN